MGNQSGGQAGSDGFNREKLIEQYDAELAEARHFARIIGLLNAICQFLAFCNLTWATVALLGAFLPNLHARDFALVTCLILVEASRLATASFFMRLLLRPLAHYSQEPRYIKHNADEQYPRSRSARIFSNVLQFILIAPSLVVSITGQVFLNYGSTNRNLQSSLRIFYSFVALNSLVALVYLIYSARAFISLNKPPEQSVLRYFDTVLERACMSSGLVQADNFEFFQFAYTMLGGEFGRNVQPRAVAKSHKKMLQYMYAHRLGVDFLEIYLDADDAFVRLAAVNMVGFWADREWGVGVPVPDLKLPKHVLTKLADKVATGQVGWAAANSFGVLASLPNGAHIVESTHTSSNVRLPDRLADVIDDSSSRSLSLVRALVGFYEQLCQNAQGPPLPFTDAERDLVPKLKKLAREVGVHRLRVQAAYLLLLMGKGLEETVILAIDPNVDTYWFESEVSMLTLLRSHIRVAPLRPRKTEEDRNITPPSWARPQTVIRA